MVAQGSDPIPTVGFALNPYRIEVIKCGTSVSFSIGYKNETVSVFSWEDDGKTYGPILDEGKIGFRQMTPLMAEYANLVVKEVVPA